MVCLAKNLQEWRQLKKKGQAVETHLWGGIQTLGNRTSNTTLSSSISADYHVEIWTRGELDIVVGGKIEKLDLSD